MPNGAPRLPMIRSDSSRAILTSLFLALGQIVGVATYLLLTPILFQYLGERAFGVYQFAQRLSAFGGFTNLSATTYLKIRLSALRRLPEPDPKRLAVGVCVVQWALWLPAMLIFLGVATQLAVGREPVSGPESWAVTAIVALVPIAQLLSIPNVALFSSNLGYKSVPVAPLAAILSALMVYAGVRAGLGLAGVAGAMYLAAAFAFVITYRIASRHLDWFGVNWPSWRDVRSSMRGNVGASVASFSYMALQQIEAVSFGLLFGPAALGRLVISGAPVHFLELVVRQFINASIPALAPLVRERACERLQALRTEAALVITLLFMFAAAPVILLTKPFVGLWVGSDAFLSAEVVVALFLVANWRVLAHFDILLLDQAEDFFGKALVLLFVVCCIGGLLMLLVSGGDDHVLWAALLCLGLAVYLLLLQERCSRKLQIARLPLLIWSPSLAALASYVLHRWVIDYEQGRLQLLLVLLGAETLCLAVAFSSPAMRRAGVQVLSRLGRFRRDVRRQ